MAESGAWLLVLSAVFLCNALKILLPSCSSIVSDGTAPAPRPPGMGKREGGAGPKVAGRALRGSPPQLSDGGTARGAVPVREGSRCPSRTPGCDGQGLVLLLALRQEKLVLAMVEHSPVARWLPQPRLHRAK